MTTISSIQPTTPSVTVGLGSLLGAGATIVAGAGAVWAAIQGKDLPATVAAGAGLLAVLGTLGARTAQTIALIRHGAHDARPYIEAGLDLLDPEADLVSDGELPTDEQEFASPPPDASNTPIQPSQAGITEA